MDSRLVLLVLLVLTGCASQSAKQRAILEWQTEGHHVYRVSGDREYFVRCTNGEKFVGFWIPETGYYQAYGPMGICSGEKE